MNGTINGVRYVPESDLRLTDERLHAALLELTAIQYFSTESHKHRSWAWDALNALAPELAALSPRVAFNLVREAA